MKRYSSLVTVGAFILGASGCSSSSSTLYPEDASTVDGSVDVAVNVDAGADQGVDSNLPIDTAIPDGSAIDSSLPDAVAMDALGTDAPDDVLAVDAVLDVATDTAVSSDTPSPTDAADAVVTLPTPCTTGHVVNLNTAGTLAGPTTTYSGSTVGAVPTDFFGGGVCGAPGYELALQYTTRAVTRLLVSTENPGTPGYFDTVAFATTTCAPLTASATSLLGCNDNAAGATLQSQFTSTTVAAGTTVYVVVAGTTPPIASTYTDTGPFQLTVTELVQVALGGACDPSFLTSYCVDGSSCTGTGATATCTASGASGMPCRSDPGSTPCNTGLACSLDGVCVTLDALGATCDPDALHDVCPVGASCVGDAPTAVCIVDGTLGGACSTDPGTTPCNTGLACREGTCVAVSGGYTESALTAPMWIDACGSAGGSHVVLVGGPGVGTNRDDNHAIAAIPLPFTFTFFGVPQTSVWPDTNGYAQFGSEPEDAVGGTGYIPSTSDGPVVAPFWDDLVLLDPVAPSTAENLCVVTTGTAPHRNFVIEWLNAYRSGHMDTTLTFEAVLHETTNTVDFVYQTLATSMTADAMWVDGSNAAIGVQSDTGIESDVHAGTVHTTAGITYSP